jgi:hypothetical protein
MTSLSLTETQLGKLDGKVAIVTGLAPGVTPSGLLRAEAIEEIRALGVPVNEMSSVALAAVFLASKKEMNGQAVTIIGDRYTEVEDALESTRNMRYGDLDADSAKKAASQRLDRLVK